MTPRPRAVDTLVRVLIKVQLLRSILKQRLSANHLVDCTHLDGKASASLCLSRSSLQLARYLIDTHAPTSAKMGVNHVSSNNVCPQSMACKASVAHSLANKSTTATVDSIVAIFFAVRSCMHWIRTETPDDDSRTSGHHKSSCQMS